MAGLPMMPTLDDASRAVAMNAVAPNATTLRPMMSTPPVAAPGSNGGPASPATTPQPPASWQAAIDQGNIARGLGLGVRAAVVTPVVQGVDRVASGISGGLSAVGSSLSNFYGGLTGAPAQAAPAPVAAAPAALAAPTQAIPAAALDPRTPNGLVFDPNRTAGDIAAANGYKFAAPAPAADPQTRLLQQAVLARGPMYSAPAARGDGAVVAAPAAAAAPTISPRQQLADAIGHVPVAVLPQITSLLNAGTQAQPQQTDNMLRSLFVNQARQAAAGAQSMAARMQAEQQLVRNLLIMRSPELGLSAGLITPQEQ